MQIANGTIQEYDIDLYRSFLVDLLNFDLGYYTENAQIPGTGFIPLNLQLTMDGLSGIRQYQTFDIDETLLPNEYYDKLKFITTTVTHKIDTKGWETTINSLGVPKNNKDPKPVDQNIPKVKTETKKDTVNLEKTQSEAAPVNTNNITSNIRKAIVEEAQKYFNTPVVGLNSKKDKFWGFTPDTFEKEIKAVGWYSGTLSHWCNWFTMLCWRNAYTSLAKTDSAIANINSTDFNDWKIQGNQNATIQNGVPRTFANMKAKGYAEELVVGKTVFYPGDMVIYSNSDSLSGRNHIGLCIDFDPSTRKIKTIGGNESNRVRLRDWFLVDEWNKSWDNRVSAVVRVITPK